VSGPAALELRGVTCTFISRDNRSQRYTAVEDVTLAVAPGEFVSVVGPTGCGKSTLLNVGAGLLDPSAGQVHVFGQPLAGINTRAG
jgi:NitT/TauT family transport system ATP-binding protein